MLGYLVEKELANYLLDFRFVVVFALTILLSALSAYVGGQQYAWQLQEYTATSAYQRESLQSYHQNHRFRINGYRWSRRPEVLSTVVYGLSGKVGQEVFIRHQIVPNFEASLFEEDPIFELFGVLDLAFIVKVVLSLVVLLITYDAICGEKEDGTLRLYASFPVPKSTLALAKLMGASLAVMVPLLFSFLVAAAVLALSPTVDLQGEDWLRMGALLVVFSLYLTVFAAFGLWASALTHRKMTAFLSLLGLWTIWVFIVPDMAVRISRRLVPVESSVEIRIKANELLWEIKAKKQGAKRTFERNLRTGFRDKGDTFQTEVLNALQEKGVEGLEAIRSLLEDPILENPPGERRGQWVRGWQALPETARNQFQEASDLAYEKLRKKLNDDYRQDVEQIEAAYYSRIDRLREQQHNRLRKRRRLMMALGTISPFSSLTYMSMDLARTGIVQKEKIEKALDPHLAYLAEFIRERDPAFGGSNQINIADFSSFTFWDSESVGECLARIAIHILSLVFLGIIGFVGAYVSILRYDVR